MPSPNREIGSKIAYTRWEPLEATSEDVEEATCTHNNNNNNNNNGIPFHHFEEDEDQQPHQGYRR